MNGLVDAVNENPEEAIENVVKKTVVEYAEKLKAVDNTTKVWVMQPYPRPKLGWTVEKLDTIHETLRIALSCADNVKVLDYLAVGKDGFDGDGIHLTTEECGKQYAHIVKILQDLRPTKTGKRGADWSEESPSLAKRNAPEMEDETGGNLEAGGSGMAWRGKGGKGKGRGNLPLRTTRPNLESSSELEKKVDRVIGRIEKLEGESMCLWETSDVSANKLNMHILMLDQVPKTKYDDATEVARSLAENVGQERDKVVIAFFLPGKTDNKSHPRMRVIFTNNNEAARFRAGGFEKRKQGSQPWKTLYISNDPTKATRVRVEIMKKIIEVIKRKDDVNEKMELFVNRFEARPMILVKMDKKVVRRITYPEAVSRWGRDLTARDLELAKKIAGKDYSERFSTVFGL